MIVAALSARQTGAANLHREQNHRALFLVEMDVRHPRDVIGVALKDTRQVPRTHFTVGGGGEWRDDRAVTVTDLALRMKA